MVMNGTLSGFLISGLFSFKVSFLGIDIAQNGRSGQDKFGPRSRKIAVFQRGQQSNSQRIIEE